MPDKLFRILFVLYGIGGQRQLMVEELHRRGNFDNGAYYTQESGKMGAITASIL